MICKCGHIIKKRTLLDGVKSIEGTLIVYIVNDKMYINDCCFITLLPSMFTFVSKSWLESSCEIVIMGSVNDETVKINVNELGSTQRVFMINESMLDTIRSYATEFFKIINIDNCNYLDDEYKKSIKNINLTYRRIIELEKMLNELKYKYSSIEHDNILMKSPINEKDENVVVTETEHTNNCYQCKNIVSIKEDLKKLREESHEQITKMKYTIEIHKKESILLNEELKKLREENASLKDVNRSLYMSR
jgi:hypothetical protein